MALRWESTGSSQVCSKFRLSPAMVRTSRLAARLFALLTRTKWEKVYSAPQKFLILLVVVDKALKETRDYIRIDSWIERGSATTGNFLGHYRIDHPYPRPNKEIAFSLLTLWFSLFESLLFSSNAHCGNPEGNVTRSCYFPYCFALLTNFSPFWSHRSPSHPSFHSFFLFWFDSSKFRNIGRRTALCASILLYKVIGCCSIFHIHSHFGEGGALLSFEWCLLELPTK